MWTLWKPPEPQATQTLTPDRLCEWAFAWARRLKDDITEAQAYFEEVKASIDVVAGEEKRDSLATALNWATAAYYEEMAGHWTQKRADAQIADAISLLGNAAADQAYPA